MIKNIFPFFRLKPLFYKVFEGIEAHRGKIPKGIYLKYTYLKKG
jgi:hypothetical protein